jgi:hypothetical protein
MGRPRKNQEIESDESEEIEKNQPQKASEFPLIMSIAQLQKLTIEEQQLFRTKGGTTTEN